MSLFGAVGSIGSAIGSATSGIGKAAGGIEGGATVGMAGTASVSGLARFDTGGPSLNSMFGPKIGPVSLPVNEGSAALADLKNTMPLQIGKSNPISEIVFAPGKPLVIQQAEEVAAAAWEKSKLPVKPMVVPLLMPLTAPKIMEFPKPQSQIVVSPKTKTESSVSVVPAPAILPQPAPQEQEVEEVVEEKKEKQDPKERLEKEEVMEKRIYLKDEKALAQRIYEIRLAFKKAGTEAKRLGLGERIAGSLVAKFMPPEHAGNRSSIVQPNGPDGSYEETIEAVKAGQFDSEDQVENVAVTNVPVKKGENGQPVKSEAVWKVLKHWTVKPTTVHEIVARRIIKKALVAPHQTVSVSSVVEQSPKAESSLKDFPQLKEACLADRQVFPKAA